MKGWRSQLLMLMEVGVGLLSVVEVLLVDWGEVCGEEREGCERGDVQMR
jgi:hypothetical protein